MDADIINIFPISLFTLEKCVVTHLRKKIVLLYLYFLYSFVYATRYNHKET